MAITTLPTGDLARLDHRASGTPQHVLGMEDLDGALELLIHRALSLKAQAKKGKLPELLAGKTVLSIYERNSTRTRVSFDVGVQRLGGTSSVLDAQTSQLARGESIEDTALVLSRYADALVYRATSHKVATEMAEHATVPVINALTDLEHPCQVLADLTTLCEYWGGSADALPGRTLAYVGDGNNMCHSYLLGAALAGMDVQVATPPGYEPAHDIVGAAHRLAKSHGTQVVLTEEPAEAVAGADAVATDTWISMGDEEESGDRLEAFTGYTVDDRLMGKANPGAVFLHCLPGHWGHEATYEVAHGPRSLILDQAENRMWSQMALLGYLVG